MRIAPLAVSLASLVPVVACGGTPAGAPDAAATVDAAPADAAPDLPVPTEGFQVRSPDIQIAAGQEITYCYYFHTPNPAPVVVKSWQSKMTAGSHHMILYFTAQADMPDGTLDPSGSCGAATNLSDLPVWTYLAQQADAESDMPADDGTGMPVGMAVPAAQPAVMQMHYLNSTDAPITVHVTLDANGYPAGTTYTPAAAFVTYNTKIDIPAGVGQTDSVAGSCTVAPSAKFFSLSTHSHKQSVETQVHDGSAAVLVSTDWEHPAVQAWAAPFYSFASGKLTYQCDYVNQGNAEIKTGPSAQTNEMCMAVGYRFPATASAICINSTVVN